MRCVRPLVGLVIVGSPLGCVRADDALGCLDCGCESELDLSVVDRAGMPVDILGGVVVVGDERFNVDCSEVALHASYVCEQGFVRLELGASAGVGTEVEAELYGASWTLVAIDPQLPTWDPQCDYGREGCPPACVWGELRIQSGLSSS